MMIRYSHTVVCVNLIISELEKKKNPQHVAVSWHNQND